jgi:hypothetical protein
MSRNDCTRSTYTASVVSYSEIVHCLGTCVESLKTITKGLSKCTWCSGRDSNREPQQRQHLSTYSVTIGKKDKTQSCSCTNHEGVVGSEIKLQYFLISVLDRGEWSASRSGRFTFRERAHGWVGPRVAGRFEGERMSCLFRDSNPGVSSP